MDFYILHTLNSLPAFTVKLWPSEDFKRVFGQISFI